MKCAAYTLETVSCSPVTGEVKHQNTHGTRTSEHWQSSQNNTTDEHWLALYHPLFPIVAQPACSAVTD